MLTSLHNMMRKITGPLGCAWLLMMLLSVVTDASAQSSGGVTITNQATATYFYGTSSLVTITSNVVVASSYAVEGIKLEENQQLASQPGASVKFSHILTNTGNIPTEVMLTVAGLPGSDFSLSGIKIVEDLNGNGVADPGEPVLEPGDKVSLDVGQQVSLILVGTVPTTANAGDLSNLQLVAVASAGSTAQVKDIITIAAQLILKKSVAQSTVSVGETANYTIELTNPTGKPMEDVVINDVIPPGFSYVAHSVRLNSAPIPDPEGMSSRTLHFVIGHLNANQTVTLTYQLRVGAGAAGGNGVNTATAQGKFGALDILSNVGHAKVIIEKSVFDTSALIVGKIFVDCNRNDLQGMEELGIPGVRFYLDDGTFVISDEEGKFSIYGLKPRTYTLKVDRTTLPAGAEMATVSNRNAGDPQSRFVDLKNGEMHRADFAEGSCTPEILAQVKARRKAAGEVRNARIQDVGNADSDPLLQPLHLTEDGSVDPRSRPAAGTIDKNGQIVADVSQAAVIRDRDSSPTLDRGPLARTPSVKLEAVLPKLTGRKLGFIDLKDGDTLPGSDLAVRVSGELGAIFKLFVNDEEIPARRVGQRARMPSRQLQAWEYIGIKLHPGKNQLRAESDDDFGNKREETSITLIAPGAPGKLSFVLPPDGAVADGQTPARILVRLNDDKGVPVTARTMITLESSVGKWDVEDLDPNQPAVQTFIEGGEALFDLIPPATPGTVSLRVSSGDIQADARLPMNAHLRPLIASGIIEGAIGLNKLSNHAVQPATAADGFEQDIKDLNSDGTNAGIRGSMFLKGKVKGNYLLTLAYDSDKDTQQRLFRDIDPENYYPIYGDSSVKGFDAQSTSKLYVRIDKGRSYLMYGDFLTNAEPDSARQLGNYSRSLTGAKYHLENNHVTVNLFASHEASEQQSTEFRAQGISGPYQLPGKGFIPNSEKIEVVTRDLNQPSLVLNREPQTRFVDYTIDTLKGSIIFNQPVSGIDGQGNPVYIRVTWEVDNGGREFWVYGADGVYHLNKYLDIGAAAVHDESPDSEHRLYSANARLNISDDTQATVEVARSEDEVKGSGNAWRAEVTRAGRGAEGRIYVAQTDDEFNNPNGSVSSGAREAGIKGGLKLTENMRLGVEGLYSDSSSNGGGVREGIFSNVEYAVTPNLKMSVGVRVTHQDAAAVGAAAAPGTPASNVTDSDVTSVNTKLSWTPQALSKAAVFTEYEQAVDNSSERMLRVGGTYQVADRSRIYASHELISSATGPFGLSELSQDQNTTKLGLEYGYMKNGSAFSEYRVRDALEGQQALAAMGLRNGWNISEGVKLTTAFERQQPLSYGNGSEQSTSVSVGAQYTGDPLLRAGARLEWRKSSSQTSILNTIALARKLSLDWSVLGKNTLSWTDAGASAIDITGLSMTGPVVRDRFRVGAAWRQTDDNRWAWLGLYETRYDRDPDASTTRTAHVVSSNVNYQPNRQLVLAGRYAFKYVRENNNGIGDNYSANLISGRAMFDITEKWDAGIIASTVFDRSSLRYGLGLEAGYLITSNLWLSAGYNFFGYEDRDFDNSNSTRRGFYVRLRFKFDEELFRWLE